MTIKEIAAQGIKSVRNDMDEIRHTTYDEKTKTASIIFPNGWVASVIRDDENPEKWSVAVCDYNGYFDWNVLQPFGTCKKPNILGDHKMVDTGCVMCDTEDRVCDVLQGIKAFS